MKFRKQRYVPSLAKAPVLRTIRTTYSVRYHVFNPKVNEQLCSISRQGSFNLVTINYGRLKHWLKKGLSFHPSNLLETDQILWHKGLTPLSKHIYKQASAQQKYIPVPSATKHTMSKVNIRKKAKQN
jgi:hypothetical protein